MTVKRAKLDDELTLSFSAKTKKHLTKRDAKFSRVIYVYCPNQEVEKIKAIAEKYDFQVVLNDYSLTTVSDKVICHYQSSALTQVEQNFLIKSIKYGAWVEPFVSYLDRRFGYTEIELLHGGYFLHQKSFSILSSRKTQIAKRALDLAAALILGILSLPICILTAILIKLESKGPVFYKQNRTGLFNNEFEVIKFRSMTTDAEAQGAQWAQKNDSRVTKIGKFIRKTRIDELPQIINIIKGEMSIVGPRPEREVFIENLEKKIPYYRFRHAVKPGVTGLAQVSYPYGASVEDAEWKHKFDIHYIKHHSFLFDIKILLLTVKVVVFGMGQ
ncbi:exopolysaccharide biosynthesis polyprenyl glycosylphosphotransferase [Ferrimonas futtsuensis]|uniref:exopolysaccharide biosynthesis polyprenyl glycosylphosphotransferase n=1 Tax=Ferrimonas futtsuensis TaxID=364764 RepID=UPI000427D792|nr:exopolysaccharide biosynthesis polyprenyl glycosylphosphotransferase [Ferrimonas futtsuensis]